MDMYTKNLHISDEVFENMRKDTDRVLQKLIKNMIEKESFEGKVTIGIDVQLFREYIPNRDPRIEGETRAIFTPKFLHKVGSVMQIKNETKGEKNLEGMELVWDEERAEYICKPIANTEQMTIFDAEFREVVVDSQEETLEGRCVAALPGVVWEEDEEIPDKEPESDADGYSEAETDPLAGAINPPEEDIPFYGSVDELDDEYDYEDPEDEE